MLLRGQLERRIRGTNAAAQPVQFQIGLIQVVMSYTPQWTHCQQALDSQQCSDLAKPACTLPQCYTQARCGSGSPGCAFGCWVILVCAYTTSHHSHYT
jgi:hypothetical protein